MNKTKKHYEAPDTTVTQVEVESSICGGSIDIQNPSTDYKIENQDVNDTFGGDFSDSSWDEVTNN